MRFFMSAGCGRVMVVAVSAVAAAVAVAVRRAEEEMRGCPSGRRTAVMWWQLRWRRRGEWRCARGGVVEAFDINYLVVVLAGEEACFYVGWTVRGNFSCL